MKKRNFLSGRLVFSGTMAFILVLGLSAGTFAAAAKPYYEGKVITFIVPVGPGGGTDIWARSIAKYFSEHIPGKPNIVIRNMPGAGSLIGANYAYKAKPDGLTCLLTNQTTILNNILRPKGTDHKIEEMTPVYASPQGSAFVAKSTLFKEPKDVMKTSELIFGHMPATGGTTSLFIWSKQLLGFQAKKMILAYAGSGDARLAFISGETNVFGGTTASIIPLKPYMEKGEVVPFFQSGIFDKNEKVVGEPAFPGFPTTVELYRQIYSKEPSGTEYEVFKAVVGTATFNKSILLPPKTPKDITDTLKKAAIDMLKDPDFMKETEKLNPGGVNYVGDALDGYVKGVSAPANVVQYMKEILTKEYGVRF